MFGSAPVWISSYDSDTETDPFFQSRKHGPIPLPRSASRGNSGGTPGTGDGRLSSNKGSNASVVSEVDVDRFDWAAKIHVAVAPVYYHNYVLGHLISAQLRNHLEKRVTGGEPLFMSEAAGRYLQEAVFGPGARSRWEDIVLGATGERLNLDYFVKSLR